MQSSSQMEIAPWRIRSLTKLVYSQPFELLIAFVILINATSLAILTMPDLDPQIREACEQIDLICFAIYGAELVLRIQTRLEHLRFRCYCSLTTTFWPNRRPSSPQTSPPRAHLPLSSRSSRTHYIHHSLSSTTNEPRGSHLCCTLHVRNARPLFIRPR
jgi:hypothetical protein